LKVQQARYLAALRKERSQLLDEMKSVTGLNRKYIIQLMGTDLERKPRQRQRGRSYREDVEAPLLVVAESLDFICGKRLKPVLLSTAQDLERHGEIHLSLEVAHSLAKISASTIDRILSRHRDRVEKRLPRKAPSRPSRVLRSVPMLKIPWNEHEPGRLEVDLVHHCGPSTSGDYLYTVQMVDVATGWSERYAILGRSGLVMHDAFRILKHRLPFAIREIHTDNGPEFLNGHMLRFWPQLVPGIKLTRNRPWCKNDSRFVEQKNFSLVRAYVGYRRYDTVEQTWAINYLYELMGLYYNLFQPVMRLKEKTLVKREGYRPKIARRYDDPCTPLARVNASGVLSPEQQDSIDQLRRAINPLRLRREITELIAQIKTMPNATPDEVQNVFNTLSRYRPFIKKGEWHPRLGFHLTQRLPITCLSDHTPG
jgi:hypothetical protein